MLYLYRNKYTRERFFFDSIRLIAYHVDDERMQSCRYIDMENRDIVTPYNKFGLVASGGSLLVITKHKLIAVWYKSYAYEFTYDAGVYINDEIISGVYDVRYRNCPVEYLFIDSKNSLRMGVGLKSGGVRIQSNGVCKHIDEVYKGEAVSLQNFKSRY